MPTMQRYYITDRSAVGGFRPLLDIIRDQMALGVDYIQIREKDVSARALFEFTLAVLEARDELSPLPIPTRILINTRADVALAAGADGVHLPAQAPSVTLPGLLVARSCHTLREVSNAHADLVTFGPVFDTPNKGPGQGFDQLRAAALLGTPLFALGGVTWENAESCIAAGAVGISGIRLFQQPDM